MAGKQIGATFVLRDGFSQIAAKAKGAVEDLKDKVKGASEQWNKHSKSSEKAGKSLSSVIKGAVGAAAAYASFDAAKDFLTDCVTGVMELERANERLSTLMLNTKGNTQEMADGIIAYGDELERITSIEGDATVAGASQLATFQLQGDTIKSLLPSLQNLAVAQYGVDVSQDNMIQSANLLGKVMQGQTGALSKAGVSFTEQQKKILQTGTEAEKTAALIEVLDQNFGGLAESMAQTDEGKVIQLRNAWGSVKDEIGMALMPAVQGVVGYIHQHIPQIRDTVSGACDKISAGIKWVSDNSNWLIPVLAGVAAGITGVSVAMGIMNLVMMGSSVTWIVLGIVAALTLLVAGGVALYKNWDTIKAKMRELWNGVKSVFGGIRDFVGGVWQSIKDGAKSMVNGVISGLNVLIRGANKIKFTLPEFLGGHTFGLNIPEIPMLANGGVIRSPGSVLVGERGPEILNLGRGASVIPLDRAGSGGTVNNNVFNIEIRTNELDDAAIDRFIGKVKLAMANM